MTPATASAMAENARLMREHGDDLPKRPDLWKRYQTNRATIQRAEQEQARKKGVRR
ncbi:hypothetical protein FBZ85_106149 [Azospirillum brasilense]|uniref:Uncharacterized protein n=1 Tax=Azospirillum baldaniorum TaxID=1064539 RepID=A0A9P1JZQ2_9PROT|nr:hypothetical protein [Azospirillum baldaniorum]TWA77989.1 hypothetical protein FBZ85_106149 [Azospirillum brasilense]CCD02910.1 conserved protein of unknown function [Azospirillum baldaniorum]